MTRLPAIFVSHGSPMLAIEDGAAHRFLNGYGAVLGRPKAILIASAHWLTARPTVSVVERPATIHDFGNFPEALFALSYNAPGAPEMARAAQRLLLDAGIEARADAHRGLDHGAWVPLRLLYPEADIPVAQISIQPDAGPAHHWRIGQALRPLRDDGVLILASGSMTHNLRAAFANVDATRPPAWVEAFATWVASALREGRIDDLLQYRQRAPFARENHPTEEHLLPLFVALGAGDGAVPPQRLHASFTWGALAMDTYAFP